MVSETEKVLQFFCARFGFKRMCDAFRTFKECSKDEINHRCLVDCYEKTISFDLLTKWIHGANAPKSADSLSFSKQFIYLIEFKTGNQIGHENKREKLIRGVSGKINDSERTLHNNVFPNITNFHKDRIKLRFALVVDTKEMGISALVTTLAQLSFGQTIINDPTLQVLFKQVLPDLKSLVSNPDRFDKIDIWFNDLFDTYLATYQIKDVVSICNEISIS